MSPYYHRHGHPYVGGIILVTIGVVFLLGNLGLADVSDLIHTYWPVILVIVGLSLLLRRSGDYESATVTGPAQDTSRGTWDEWKSTMHHSNTSTNAADRVLENSTFGDTLLTLTSRNFQGGTISSVFGDTEIDTTAVEPALGEQVLRIHSVFGDTRVAVPKGIALRVTADTSFGGLRVMNASKDGMFQHLEYAGENYATADRKLHIIVSHVFGDLRVW